MQEQLALALSEFELMRVKIQLADDKASWPQYLQCIIYTSRTDVISRLVTITYHFT